MDEIHLIPAGNGTNALVDAVALTKHGFSNLYVLRDGQTAEEFFEEQEASRVRLELGLPPGRTMPTKEEIAAGPLPPEPVIDRVAALEARLSLVESKIEADVTAELAVKA